MIQVVKQTDKEKMLMYMKCSKKELAKMLIQCNKHLDAMLYQSPDDGKFGPTFTLDELADKGKSLSVKSTTL